MGVLVCRFCHIEPIYSRVCIWLCCASTSVVSAVSHTSERRSLCSLVWAATCWSCLSMSCIFCRVEPVFPPRPHRPLLLSSSAFLPIAVFGTRDLAHDFLQRDRSLWDTRGQIRKRGKLGTSGKGEQKLWCAIPPL